MFNLFNSNTNHNEGNDAGSGESYSQLTTYVSVSKDGRTELSSSYSPSDAFQKASEFAGDDLLDSFEEL